jgi:hypothetical protein
MQSRQAGVTALGFLLLATVFGLVGFGGIKLAPLYMQKMTINTVLNDLKEEYDGAGATTAALRRTLVQRLYLEGIRIDPEDIVISPTNVGYNVGIEYDNRASFIADVSFLVAVDERIEIRR